MKTKILMLCIMSMFVLSIGFVMAQQQTLGTFKQNTCVTLVQTCENCTYNIVDKVLYPNSSIALSTTAMNVDGIYYYLDFCNTNTLGKYTVIGLGDLNGINDSWIYDFYSTPTGQEATTSKSITYVLLFIFSILIFGALVFMGVAIPYSNKKDEMTGYIIAVSNIKYLKLIFLGMAYVVAIFIAYFSWMLSYAYLDMEFLSDILRWIFNVLTVLTLPMFILFVYLTIANLVRDSDIAGQLARGFEVNGN